MFEWIPFVWKVAVGLLALALIIVYLCWHLLGRR